MTQFQCSSCGRWFETDGEVTEAITPEVTAGGLVAPEPLAGNEPCVECGSE